MDTGLDYDNNNLVLENEKIKFDEKEKQYMIEEIESKENLLEEKKDISNVDVLYEKLQKQFNDSSLIIKTLHNNLKLLYKEVLKEEKIYKNQSK